MDRSGQRSWGGRIVRASMIFGLLFAYLLGLMSPIHAAGTTGSLSGTITAGDTKAPLVGARITAVAPTGRYTTRTDQRGFFSFTGVTPDTYTVSVEASGYDTSVISGITVSADQQQTVTQALAKSLTRIGGTRTSQRSQGTAFQPAQTTDTYTITSNQIDTVLGKKFNTDEASLLASLPGVTFDSSGYPTLRGGRVTEEGFQFEGIDYTDAFLSQFVNTLALAGTGSLQLTPGAGDASSGNTGTGIINLIAKRGTYPAFGSLDLEAGGNGFSHQLGFEFGTATPNGRFSNYMTFIGQRSSPQYGYSGVPTREQADFFGGRSAQVNDNFVDNFVYRFGRDNSQSLQLFYQAQNNEFYFNKGGLGSLYYKTNDPYTLFNLGPGVLGLTQDEIQSVASLEPGQTSLFQRAPSAAPFDSQPNATYKLQYTNNLNSSTFLSAKVYKVNAVSDFTSQFGSNSFYFDAVRSQQGGLRTGTQLQLTKQLSSKHLVEGGGKYEFLTPVFDYPDTITGLAAVDFNAQILDFLNPNTGSCGGPSGPCGYLGQYFPGAFNGTIVNPVTGVVTPAGVPVPEYLQQAGLHRQDFALYVQDTWSPNDNLKVNYGVRMDGVNYRYPGYDAGGYNVPGGYSGMFLPTSTGVFTSGPNAGLPDPSQDRFDYDKQASQPRVLEPKIGFSLRMGRNDAIRASYARSVQFVPIGFVDTDLSRTPFIPFLGIPNGGATANAAGQLVNCGPTGDRLCRNYADSLYWNYQNNFGGIPFQPVKPETFSNWEFSYEHAFKNNLAVKLTPFYRRGYDALVQTASQKIVNGVLQFDATGAPIFNPSVSTSLGINRTTGVEFYVTKDAEYGFSGSLSATYINEFTNVPPTQGNEDFLPTIPAASLELGNQYRVGYLSPFQFTLAPSYRFHNGIKITPNIQYNMGYPIGSGQITQVLYNGKAYNVSNTNLTNSAQLGGPQGAGCYVDPQNPGSIFAPNVSACRGTPDGPSAGSVLSNQNIIANVALEFTPPKHGKYTNTIGIKVDNIFGDVYGIPAINALYQPAAQGYGGPRTGISANPGRFPGNGFTIPTFAAYSFSPYTNYPNNVGRTFRVYYQIGF